MRALVVLTILALGLFTPLDPRVVQASSPTGFEVAPVFKAFYDRYGGLPTFGYPISPPFHENGYLVQYFERQRFEHHPEYAGTEYEVLLGLLGREVAQREGRDLRRSDPRPGHRYFPETGHNMWPGFATYWERRGGLRLFGYPITEPFWENGLLIQYFERARFEYHPANAGTQWEILLGRLGAEVYTGDTAGFAGSLPDPRAQELANRINRTRQQSGLAPLTLDPVLTRIAQERCDDMARRGYFSHTTPEGRTVFDLLDAYRVDWRYAGETLQRNNYPADRTVAEAARSLFASTSHRALLLDPRFSHFGVASATSRDGMHYYTIVLIQR
jgi:uncharacterized protein YkwD